MPHVTRLLTALMFVLTFGPAWPAAGQTQGCSVVEKNLFVRDVMSDIYLWYQNIPNLDPARFNSPEEYLEAIRFRPDDDRFSYITDRAASEALFQNSEYVGFGFSSAWRGYDLRITQVFPGSSADEAGLMRGDRIIALGGRPVAELIVTGGINTALGPAEAGFTLDIVFTRGAVQLAGRIVKRPVIIPTVSHTRVVDVGGRKVGYLFFRNFVEPSTAALDEAFAEFRRQGVHELVLDLRYNGGGLVNVAQHLGGLLGGTLTNGQVFAEYSHNNRNAFRNRTLRFQTPEQALTLTRVFAITTQASASASELVINSLRPFLPVVVIGDRTYGKPVGQYVVPFCDKILAPVSFALRNAKGEGDFFDGLQPTCRADDGLDHQIGDIAEASFREAIAFITTGGCSPVPLPRRPERRSGVGAVSPDGWSVVVGAN